MKPGTVALRIAQAVFVTLIIMGIIRKYTAEPMPNRPSRVVQVQDCVQKSRYASRCITYLAELDSMGYLPYEGPNR